MQLFEPRAAGVHAKMITGYLKGAGYFPDYHFGDKSDPFRGSWNAVLIDGQWRLLDTNWGSRHVTGRPTLQLGVDRKTCPKKTFQFFPIIAIYFIFYFISDHKVHSNEIISKRKQKNLHSQNRYRNI